MSLTFRLMSSVACSLLLACSSKVSGGGSTLDAAGAASLPSAGSGGGTGTGDAPSAPSGTGGGLSLNIDAGADDGGSGGASSGAHIITTLPAGFQATDMGGLLLGAPLSTGGAGGTGGATGGIGSGGAAGSSGSGGSGGSGGVSSTNGNCGNVLVGVVRDFRGETEGGSPDFESSVFWGGDVTHNLVSGMLGTDQKPVYTSMCELATAVQSTTCPYGPETTTQTNFDQWYREAPGLNQPFQISIYLAPQPGGLFTFQSLHYFPVDNAGFGASAKADDGLMHNFGFTTEIHTQFSYTGGETFQFQGDDDVWVFINGKLAVDLGGLHPAKTGTADLDASAATLGIQKGNVYNLDLFHAERHSDKSTFRIDTNLSFVNCGSVPSVPK